jgi:hypothetical protein
MENIKFLVYATDILESEVERVWNSLKNRQISTG